MAYTVLWPCAVTKDGCSRKSKSKKVNFIFTKLTSGIKFQDQAQKFKHKHKFKSQNKPKKSNKKSIQNKTGFWDFVRDGRLELKLKEFDFLAKATFIMLDPEQTAIAKVVALGDGVEIKRTKISFAKLRKPEEHGYKVWRMNEDNLASSINGDILKSFIKLIITKRNSRIVCKKF